MNIPRIIIVLGQMRSGTSAIAEIVHRLGVPMGRSFVAPKLPTMRFEWEDTELSMVFARYWTRRENPEGGWLPWWKGYLNARAEHARWYGTDRFGLKTPPLALLLDTLLPEARKLGPVALIHVERPQPSIDASLRLAFPPGLHAKATAANASIQKKLDKLPCDLRVPYDELTNADGPPGQYKNGTLLWVTKIAELLHVYDNNRIRDAIENVKESTWQQSSGASPQQESSAGAT